MGVDDAHPLPRARPNSEKAADTRGLFDLQSWDVLRIVSMV